MAARITEVRDAIVTRIDDNWTKSAGDEVSGKYRSDIEAASVGGRKVNVFPLSTAGQPVDREEDQNDYSFGVWVVERYTGDGDPTEEWLDERVAWVEWLWKLLSANRTQPRLLVDAEVPNSGLWCEEGQITTVYDHDDLVEGKLFSSALTFTYREHAEGP